MIPVALPTYNRPEYLKQTLAWLEANKYANDILLVTSEEPYKPCQDIISRSNLAKERIINNKRKGLCANVCQAITAAAQKAEWFVCVEDDVLVGYDAIEQAERAFTKGANIVNFENPYSNSDENASHWLEDDWFHCHGWACKSEFWNAFMRCFEANKFPYSSWANPFNWFIQQQVQDFDIKILTPTLSRSYYIGEQGEFSNNSKFNKHFCENWVGMKRAEDFKVVYNRSSKPDWFYIVNECKVFYERSRKV